MLNNQIKENLIKVEMMQMLVVNVRLCDSHYWTYIYIYKQNFIYSIYIYFFFNISHSNLTFLDIYSISSS